MKKPFVSNFKQWIKSIAVIVLLVFVPDQVSWAFGYNPTVLYKNLPMVQAPIAGELAPKILPQAQIAGSVEYLLKQIQDKDKLQLKLNLDDASKKKMKRQKI